MSGPPGEGFLCYFSPSKPGFEMSTDCCFKGRFTGHFNCTSVLYTNVYRKEGTGVSSLNTREVWRIIHERNRWWEENVYN
jgi:hypothetical protein